MLDGLILIPAYNEEENIEKVLRDLQKQNLHTDILVVNDGSSDQTCACAERHSAHVISHIFNLGYGAALQSGFQYAVKHDYDFVIQFDADGQHNPCDLHDFLNEAQKGDFDIVVGSRFLQKSAYKTAFMKRVAIHGMRFMIKNLTGFSVTDPTSGFKMLSKKVLQYYSVPKNFPSDYPDANLLIKMLRKKYKVKELPITIRPRIYGTAMHAGLEPLFYLVNICLSVTVNLLREILKKEK